MGELPGGIWFRISGKGFLDEVSPDASGTLNVSVPFCTLAEFFFLVDPNRGVFFVVQVLVYTLYIYIHIYIVSVILNTNTHTHIYIYIHSYLYHM